MLTNPIDCPVCKATHPSISRLGSFNVIACEDFRLGEVGNVHFYPKLFVIVVKAGMYVDQMPAAKLSADKLQQRIDSLKTARASGAATNAGKSVAELEAELAALEKA